MKTSYSKIQSRLFQSYSKSKSKSPFRETGPQIIKKSIQKIQQLGNQHYAKAMKHMNKVNVYQTNILAKKQKQKQLGLDSQCTFKPTLYKSKYPNLITNRKGKQAIKQQINQSSKIVNQKKKLRLNIGIINDFQNTNSKQLKSNKTANRLITWAKNKDKKIINKTIQIQVQKSLSRQSYRSSVSISKKTSYANLHKSRQSKLNLIQKDKNKHNSGSRSNILKQFGSFTPKNGSIQRLTIQTQDNHYYSAVQTPKNSSFYKHNRGLFHNNQKLLNKSTINPQFKNINSLQSSLDLKNNDQIIQKQNQRGENSYYLRQAKANVKKQSLAELLIKDNTYSKKYKK